MPGWKKRSPAASLAFLAVLLPAPVAAGEADEEEALPGDFIEFLADWDDRNGQWQDPTEYEDPHWQLLDQETGQSDE